MLWAIAYVIKLDIDSGMPKSTTIHLFIDSPVFPIYNKTRIKYCKSVRTRRKDYVLFEW